MMEQIEVLKVSIRELQLALHIHIIDLHASQEDNDSIAQVLSKKLTVDLVVEQLALLFRADLIRELSPADTISDGDHSRTEHVESTTKDNGKSCHAHDRVEKARIRLELKVALFRDLCESR